MNCFARRMYSRCAAKGSWDKDSADAGDRRKQGRYKKLQDGLIDEVDGQGTIIRI